MTREEKAVYYKHNGFNCCQSVIKAMIDSSDSDKEILTNAASGFAVGMGGMEATCGALIGATMMAGIVKPGEEKCDNGTGDIKQISGIFRCNHM